MTSDKTQCRREKDRHMTSDKTQCGRETERIWFRLSITTEDQLTTSLFISQRELNSSQQYL